VVYQIVHHIIVKIEKMAIFEFLVLGRALVVQKMQ